MFIEAHEALRQHHKVFLLASRLGVPNNYVKGALVSLWLAAITQGRVNGSLHGWSNQYIAMMADHNNNADEFVSALVETGWLDRSENGVLHIHDADDYFEYLRLRTERRENDRERKREERERKRKAKEKQALSASAGRPSDGPQDGKKASNGRGAGRKKNVRNEPNLTQPNLTKPHTTSLTARCSNDDASRSVPSGGPLSRDVVGSPPDGLFVSGGPKCPTPEQPEAKAMPAAAHSKTSKPQDSQVMGHPSRAGNRGKIRPIATDPTVDGRDSQATSHPSGPGNRGGDQVISESKAENTTRARVAESIGQVYAYYRGYHPRCAAKLKTTSLEYRRIRDRLDEGYTVADLCEAIDGIHAIPHNQGVNETGRKYLGLDLIFRSTSHVQRYIEANSTDAKRLAAMGKTARQNALHSALFLAEVEREESHRDT